MPGPPPPPAAPKRNTALIIGLIAGALALCLIAVCAAAVGALAFLNSEEEPRNRPLGISSPAPLRTTTAPSFPSRTYSPPERTRTTEAPDPPPAKIGQCIVVNETGDFQGIGNCNGTRGTYRVVSVDASRNDCADPDSAYITEDGYRLCLERHLVRNYCYKFPTGEGWIVGAPKCKAKGTVHIIDIVPGASNGNRCTQDYKWNRWYRFTNPVVVYCVMKY